MILPDRRRLGAIALVVAGVGAFLAPFLIHGPALQANSNGNGGGTTPPTKTTPPSTGCITNCSPGPGPAPGPGPGSGPPHKKTLKDLMNSVNACSNEDHPGWTRSLDAKIRAAMNSQDSTRTDNHLVAFDHQLDTPAASNHVGACLIDINSVLKSVTGS